MYHALHIKLLYCLILTRVNSGAVATAKRLARGSCKGAGRLVQHHTVPAVHLTGIACLLEGACVVGFCL